VHREGDRTILLRDHGAVGFTMLLRFGWPILALLLILALLIGPMVDGWPASDGTRQMLTW